MPLVEVAEVQAVEAWEVECKEVAWEVLVVDRDVVVWEAQEVLKDKTQDNKDQEVQDPVALVDQVAQDQVEWVEEDPVDQDQEQAVQEDTQVWEEEVQEDLAAQVDIQVQTVADQLQVVRVHYLATQIHLANDQSEKVLACRDTLIQ